MADELGSYLQFHRVKVGNAWWSYAAAGSGQPLLFLHGWALRHQTYERVLSRLVNSGFRVLAPDLPGFGGSTQESSQVQSFEEYSDWVVRFCKKVGHPLPTLVVGHSFGGGVAISLADRHPEAVASLVLVNSVGGAAWSEGDGPKRKVLADRPLWDWGVHFPSELLSSRQIRSVLPVVARDAVGNFIKNPKAVVRVAKLASQADLTDELERLKDRGLPVAVLWGKNDRILPKASFDALCKSLGAKPKVVDGSHGWLFVDPDQFAEVLTNAIGVAELAQSLEENPDEEITELSDLRPRSTDED